VLAGGYVLAGSGGGSNGYRLACVRPSTEIGTPAEVVYVLKKSVPQVPTPVALGDLLFVVHDRGTASCRDLATGEEYWIERLGSRFSASPICVGGRVYCVGEEGTVKVLAADKEFRMLGEGQVPGIAYATPAVAGDHLLFRTESGLYCLAAEAP
jgi:outer membrane protein assembly factor BamB